jgi:hypothetical protein
LLPAKTALWVSKKPEPATDLNSPLSTKRWTAARGTPAARAISSIVKTSSWDSMDAQVQKANPLPPVGSVFRPELRNKSQSDTRVSLQQVIGARSNAPADVHSFDEAVSIAVGQRTDRPEPSAFEHSDRRYRGVRLLAGVKDCGQA